MIVEVDYTCLKCGATDKDKLLPETPAIPIIICGRCHFGSGLNFSDAMASQAGAVIAAQRLVDYGPPTADLSDELA